MCKEEKETVSLSDRLTKGIVEFFGNVVFEFDALSLYKKNRLIMPTKYGSSSNIEKYGGVPLFKNEWTSPKEVKFQKKDIRRVLFITSRNFKESKFKNIAKKLKELNIQYDYWSEIYLPYLRVSDFNSYLIRMRRWRKFANEKIN